MDEPIEDHLEQDQWTEQQQVRFNSNFAWTENDLREQILEESLEGMMHNYQDWSTPYEIENENQNRKFDINFYLD